MDMMVIGFRNDSKVGGQGLTPTEEEAHFGLWCIMSSPLLIGCNLENMPDSSLELLTNKELIALNQDPLGLQAYVAQHENEGYVLVKDIEQKRGMYVPLLFTILPIPSVVFPCRSLHWNLEET